MFQSTYYIDKSSNTFSDYLAGFGLAFVLNGIARGRSNIRMEDQGSVFAVLCQPALQAEWVDQCEFFTGAPFLLTWDKGSQTKMIKGTALALADLPQQGGSLVVDYQAEKEGRQVYFDWLYALSSADRRKAVRGELRGAEDAPAGPRAPHPDWELLRAVNPAALQSYNSLIAEWWRGREAFSELLKALLQMTCQTPNDGEHAEKAWQNVCKERHLGKPKDATASQLLNPAQGKGVNSSKAVWSNPNNVKGFWLLEWLKLIGLRYGGMTRLVSKTKDRKTYALVPSRLDWGRHTDIMAKYQQAMVSSTSAVKMDILAALRYTQALLEHFEAAREEDLAAELFGHSASDLVSGLQMAYYKSLGNAIATMNIASINLPHWVKPDNRSHLAEMDKALDEHVSVIFGLDESKGDQFELLRQYRDFLSGYDLTPFFEFTTAYSGFIISQYERRKFVRPFTTTTLEVLFMNSDSEQHTYSRIVQDEGFRNVAYAIRHSTVVPQARKSRGNRPSVNIRYGLGQQLARKSAYADEFMAELAEFMHLYNAENAQLRENKRNPFRKNITTADIDAIATLVDQFGSKVICNMLVAYGYAREPYEAAEDETSSVEVVESEAQGDEETEGDEE